MKTLDHVKLSPVLLILLPIYHNLNSFVVASLASVLIDTDHLQIVVKEKAYSYLD